MSASARANVCVSPAANECARSEFLSIQFWFADYHESTYLSRFIARERVALIQNKKTQLNQHPNIVMETAAVAAALNDTYNMCTQ